MSKKSYPVTIIEAERDESINFVSINSLKIPHNSIVLCDCDYGGECLNNPDKKLIGMFTLCRIYKK